VVDDGAEPGQTDLMGAFRRCPVCEEHAISQCARCDAPLCRKHQPKSGKRCRTCERDYLDDALMRNRMKALLGLPPAALATAAVFAILFPLGPGFVGAVAVAAAAALAGSSTAAVVFRAVDRSARAQFLREHGLPLPPMRVVRLLRPG
jgi:hypothetical protein